MAQTGIRPDFDFAKLAIDKYGIIKKSGGWYTLCDPATGEILIDETAKPIKVNGAIKVYEYLQTHPDYYASVQKFILDDINGKSDVDSDPQEVV